MTVQHRYFNISLSAALFLHAGIFITFVLYQQFIQSHEERKPKIIAIKLLSFASAAKQSFSVSSTPESSPSKPAVRPQAEPLTARKPSAASRREAEDIIKKLIADANKPKVSTQPIEKALPVQPIKATETTPVAKQPTTAKSETGSASPLSSKGKTESSQSARTGEKKGSPTQNPTTVKGESQGSSISEFKMQMYHNMVYERVREYWRLPETLIGNQKNEVLIAVVIDRSGNVLSEKIEKPSGNSFFDQSAMHAIKRSSPLPGMPAEFTKTKYSFSLLFRATDYGQ